MRNGLRLVEWFADEAWRVYASCRETQEERERRSLLEWIAARGGRVTAKQLQDSLRHRYPTSEEAEAALDALREAKLGDWQEQPSGPKGGRPTRLFVLPETRPRNRDTPRPLSNGQHGPIRETPRETSPGQQKPSVSEGFAGFAGAVSGNGEGPDGAPGGSAAAEVSRAQDDGDENRPPGRGVDWEESASA
jgi:hypothetical protein